MDFLFGHHHRNRSGHNDTLDVTSKTCFADYNTVACLRSSFLCGLTLITALICLARIIRLHLDRRPDFHQYAVFYMSVVQCLVSSVEWVLGWTPHASLICLYLQCCAVLVVCHFYLVFTCRLLNLSDRKRNWLVVPILLGFFLYFTAMLALGLMRIDAWWCACFIYQWLALVSGQVVLLQILFVVLLVLLRRICLISAEERLKKSQRLDILVLLATFELAVMLSLSYHVTIKIKQVGVSDCSEVFHHEQVLYSSVRVPVDIFSFLVPIWALLFIFRRTPADAENYSQLDSNVTSISEGIMADPSMPIDPTLIPSPVVRQWRRYYRPINARLILPHSAPNYQQIVRSRTLSRFRRPTGDGSLRRSSSSPSVARRGPQPVLATIPEESSTRSRVESGESGNIPVERRTASNGVFSAPTPNLV